MFEDWFEKTREYREEVLYPQLFGTLPAGGARMLTGEVFVDLLGQRGYDPRWIHVGVFACPPCDGRDHWLYVSSGLSNEWWSDEPNAVGRSGIGNEFVLELRHHAGWAVPSLLQICAMQILLADGRYEGRTALAPYDRLPLRLPHGVAPTSLSHFLVVPSPGLPETSRLRSGYFHWFHLVGITPQEAAFADQSNRQALLRHLATHGRARITDPARESTV